MRLLIATSLLVAVALTSCTSKPSKRAQEQLEELQRKKDAAAKAQKETLAPLPVKVVQLPAPYDDGGNVAIVPDAACPPNFWALFPGDAPGATPEEKKANAARRKELADEVMAKQYMVKLRSGDVKLNPFDAPAGRFTINLVGTIDCTDSMGHIAVAWTDAKAGDPGNSAAKEGAEVTQNMWMAPPMVFNYPMTSQTEAKSFFDSNRFALSARVVFKLGKAEVDKKLKKVAKVAEKVELAGGMQLGYGGGMEDWGAGRLVRAELIGVRVATDQEKKQLFDERPTKK